jgi:hypothetical protein
MNGENENIFMKQEAEIGGRRKTIFNSILRFFFALLAIIYPGDGKKGFEI